MSELKNEKIELTTNHIQRIFNLDDSQTQEWFPLLKETCSEYGIEKTYQLAAFFATIGHESSDLQRLEENLNYSSDRLLVVFGNYFSGETQADEYAGQPKKIASRVYADRLGNGDEASQEGWLYRGRGLIQLTGKDNYSKIQRSGIPGLKNPDYLMTKTGAAKSAGWFWMSRDCNTPADQSNVEEFRRLVNGGDNGLDDVRQRFEQALKVLCDIDEDVEIQTDPNAEPDPTFKGLKTENTLPNPEESPTPDSKYETLEEPSVTGKSQYPLNKVYESRSGHIFEVDDTPGAERIHQFHRSGSYTEYHPDGKLVQKAVHERWDMTAKDRNYITQQTYTHTIEQDWYMKIKGKVVFNVGKDMTVEAQSKIQFNTPTVNCSDTVKAKTGEIQTVNSNMVNAKMIKQASGVANLTAKSALHALKASALGGPPSGGAGRRANSVDVVSLRHAPKILRQSDSKSGVTIDQDNQDLLTDVYGDMDVAVVGDSIQSVDGNVEIECGGSMNLHADEGVKINGLDINSSLSVEFEDGIPIIVISTISEGQLKRFRLEGQLKEII